MGARLVGPGGWLFSPGGRATMEADWPPGSRIAALPITMWIRKRFDIPDGELFRAAAGCGWPGGRDSAIAAIARQWPGDGVLPVLSVRSGFDLLFAALRLPAGSEVLMSGLTIPDMPRIVREHGLVPVGVDLEADSLAPCIAELERSITGRTRMIVVAHLFGGLCDLDPVAALARSHRLLLVEDCAQAWVGNHQPGDPRADVSMFSFGPIKTNTSLSGAVLEVRQRGLLEVIKRLQAAWPVQPNRAFFSRLIKYFVLKRIASRPGMALLSRLARLAGTSHDAWVARAARGFPGPGFFRKIRRQPSRALLELLHRRLARFDPSTARARQAVGQSMATRLARRFPVPGIAAIRQTWWVLAIEVDEPAPLVEMLWREGFDATQWSSLQPVGEVELSGCSKLLQHLVFLPFDLAMPAGELDRLVRLVLDSPAQPPAGWKRGQDSFPDRDARALRTANKKES